MSGSLSTLVAVLAALGGMSGLLIFLISRWDKKRDPVSKAEAEVALAAKALGLAEGINDRLIGEVGRLDARIALMEERHARERDEDRTEIAGLKRRMAGVIEDRDSLVAYFLVFRQWVAMGSRPPAPAVPKHLADFLPEWVPGDGAEPPSPNPKQHRAEHREGA